MKNVKTTLLWIIFVLSSMPLISQSSDMSFEIRVGLNTSDVGYGIDKLRGILPTEDYTLYSNSGNPGLGFALGASFGWNFANHFELITSFDYQKLNYGVESGVSDVAPIPANRPIRPEVPIFFSGAAGYSYLNIETGVRYSFNTDPRKGFFVGAFISDMIHLGTDWTLDVTYEDQRIVENVDFSDVQGDLEFNNVVFLGLNTGYYFTIKENFSIGPMVDIRFGLNSAVDIESAPFAMGFYLQGKWNF